VSGWRDGIKVRVKSLFVVAYKLLTVAISLFAAWSLVTSSLQLTWLGVFLTSFPPLLNSLWKFDQAPSIHHKVRQPRVSMAVLAGLALVLLSVPERSMPLWLALAATGSFLLNAYWATAED
jgi:hypothetical protein